MTGDPGRLLWIGLPGRTVPHEVKGLLTQGKVGGVILFSRNLGTPEEIRDLTTELRGCSTEPLPIGVDQEGGRVRRLSFLPWPSAMQLSRCAPAVIEEVGERMGQELSWFGFNVDFAPVLDVLTNPDNKVIGDRAFGTTPEAVIRNAGAWIRGFSRSGLSCCGKHFPGHGHTLHDSHLTLPRAELTLQDLE
ncbi:beta-N-acetylhexosaminidase, partial [Myxococcota bacterium]|nr:beta-N-acetylhexosaminidase [Myxococcota bacterium]MBU1538021.1 beta-N-acetylhexosaminidase [Myxococcota bacterium]